MPGTKTHVMHVNIHSQQVIVDRGFTLTVNDTQRGPAVNGVFSYAMPKPSRWTFAALNEDSEPMMHEGTSYPVEIGAVSRVHTLDME
jgi:hypothetical protein